MKSIVSMFALAALSLGGACGPSAGADDGDDDSSGDAGQPDAYTGPVGTISGTVWAPGNAPGMVPATHEIPIFGAVAYLSLQPPPPIPQRVHCEQCVDPPGKAVFTDHYGNFTIPNIQPNTYWLVIQKGQFRLEQEIIVGENANIQLPATQTTLPSVHDPDNGQWVPRIAIASGFWDHIEDILGKMKLGAVDSAGVFIGNTAAGVFDLYSNGGRTDDSAIMPLSELFQITSGTLDGGDIEGPMMDYHIIFIPCSTQTFGGSGLSGAPLETLQAIRAYVAAGGKLYVTDWSGEWSDNIFPEQLRFASDHDTPASAWNEATQSWNTGQFNSADGFSSTEADHARAVDDDLNTWLDGQVGPIVLPDFGGYGQGTFDADNFVVEGKYDFIEELVSVYVGDDDKGFPIYDEPHAYVIGDEGGTPATCTGTGAGCSPFTVTFEPTGCGRVLYSTYHTADNDHVGLVPQERVLLYLIMEIGVCKSGPIIN